MRKLLWAGVVLLIVSFAMWSKDPLNDVVSFIMSGSIPKTNIELGFWQTLGLVGVFSGFLYAASKALQFEMLARKAADITAEQAKQDFKEHSDPESVTPKKHSVIAASASESY